MSVTAVEEIRCAACGWSSAIDDETPGTVIALKVGAHLDSCPRRAFGHPAFGMEPRWTTELAHYPSGSKVRIIVTWGPADLWAPFHLDLLREKFTASAPSEVQWMPPAPLEIEVREGDPPHPNTDSHLARAIEVARRGMLDVIESAQTADQIVAVGARLTETEAVVEWFTETLRTALVNRRQELGGAPPQG